MEKEKRASLKRRESIQNISYCFISFVRCAADEQWHTWEATEYAKGLICSYTAAAEV